MSTSASEKENLLSITPPSGFFLRLSITQSLFKVFDFDIQTPGNTKSWT